MRMDKIIFERGHSSSEADRIELSVSPDMNIHEFKIVCERLASAIGYHSDSIKEAFSSGQTSTTNKQILKG